MPDVKITKGMSRNSDASKDAKAIMKYIVDNNLSGVYNEHNKSISIESLVGKKIYPKTLSIYDTSLRRSYIPYDSVDELMQDVMMLIRINARNTKKVVIKNATTSETKVANITTSTAPSTSKNKDLPFTDVPYTSTQSFSLPDNIMTSKSSNFNTPIPKNATGLEISKVKSLRGNAFDLYVVCARLNYGSHDGETHRWRGINDFSLYTRFFKGYKVNDGEYTITEAINNSRVDRVMKHLKDNYPDILSTTTSKKVTRDVRKRIIQELMNM